MDALCPFVDSHVVVDAFNRFRKASRGTSNRPINNQNNVSSSGGPDNAWVV